MNRLCFVMFFFITSQCFAAWEWHDRSAREWATHLPQLLTESTDTSGWKFLASVVHPFGVPEISAGHLRGTYWQNRWLLDGQLYQLGTDGYRETAIGVKGGIRRDRYWLAGGVRIGWVDVPPKPVRVVEALLLDAGYRYRMATFFGTVELPLQTSENSPIAFPMRSSVVTFLQPLEHWRIGAAYSLYKTEHEFGIGGEWTPFPEFSLRIGTDPDRGWGAGVALRLRGFSLSFASFSVEPAGWSSLWSAEVSSYTPKPGFRYPVTPP
ncbi:MAG: hypothetical protein OEM52_03105 [bacterium]|nr:hypothetical protein [bacterium]